MSKRKARSKSQGVVVSTVTGRWIVLSILFAVTLAAYWNSFGVPLVFDDLVTIQKNTSVRFGEFNWNLLSARSVLYLTFTLNYIWSGQQVWSYHLINFLLHLLNGLLIFVLAERIFRHVESSLQRCRQYAVLAAAFFLVHPVQTESVTYISSRSELLSTCFYLLGFLVYVLWSKERIGFLCSLAVAVPYFFGLGSKETVISLPATIFLYDFLFLSKGEFKGVLPRWRFYVTYVAGGLAATYYILTVALRGSVGASLPGHLSSWHYFLTQLRVIVRYIRLIYLPVGLNLDYYGFRPSTSPLEPAVIASFLFLSGVVFLGWTLRRRAPVFAFSIFWLFLTLAPTSSVVTLLDVMFEHRLYLPLVGVCISFPLFIQLVYGKLRERFAIPGNTLRYASAILTVLIAGTLFRNYTWGDEVRLFKDNVAKSPTNERAYNGLAWAYYKRSEFNNAIEVLEMAVDKMPSKLNILGDTLGNMYLKADRYDKAVEVLEKITGLFTGERLALAYNNLGVAYLYMWNDLQAHRAQFTDAQYLARREEILKPAAGAFSKGLEIDHDMVEALDSYANVMSYRGKVSDLEASTLERLKQRESFADLYTIGKIAFNSGDYAKADEYFEKAEKQRNDVTILFFNHGYALTQLNQDDRAIEKYVQAIRLNPIFIEAHHNVGLLYMRRNEYAKAIEAFAEVLRQDPKHVSSNLNLAKIYISEGNNALARGYLRTVLEVAPGDQQAAALWQQIGS
jgi:tetratricopeptide (TPR) repeat protein